MVDRVALALWTAHVSHSGFPDELQPDGWGLLVAEQGKDAWRSQARAAIAAVRQVLVDEANRMQFSEDRNGLMCAVETIEEALK